MPRITRSIIKAPLNPEKLYSKAEDVALKMKQLKNIGSDARRHFIKKGVTKEELDELGLNELFQQRRVTQDEILERIDENRIEFEEEIAIGGRDSEIDFDVDQLEMEEFFGGPYGVQSEIDNEIEQNIRDYYLIELLEADDATLDDRELELKKWATNQQDFDDLPISLQTELQENAYENLSTGYYEDPAMVVQLYVDGMPAEGYRLIQNPYDGSFLPPEDANPYLRRQFNLDQDRYARARPVDYSVRTPNEARVRLQGAAIDNGDIETSGDTLHSKHTIDGGENYREIRYRLPGITKFRESHHFPDDVNNIFHARVTDRIDSKGNNVLFVEELQSDWAQQGRKEGFMDEDKIRSGYAEVEEKLQSGGLLDVLKEFDEKVAPVDRPDFLSDLGEAAYKNTSMIDKMSSLGRFTRNVDRIIANRKKNDFVEMMSDNLNDKAKYEIASYEVMRANERMGNQTIGSEYRTYQVPDPNTEQGRNQIEMFVRNHLKTQYERLKEGEKVPPFYIQNFAMERDPRASNWREGVDSLMRELDNNNRENIADNLEYYGLPRNLVTQIEETLATIDPALPLQLAEEAEKPMMAPFVRDTNAWNKLAVKRLITIAAEEGYDKLMFSPSEVQVERWRDPRLKTQYDVNIPKAIKQVTGIKPGETTFAYTKPNDPYAPDFTLTGPSIDLNQKTPTGETVAERAKAGQTMFAVPLAAAAGLAGLAAPDMAQAGEVPIDEGIGRLPRSSGEERGILEELGDFMRYAPEVGLDALNAITVRPLAGSIAGRGAFDLGMSPEAIREAQSRAESLLDYEASPGAEAYGQRIMGGIGELLESDAAKKAAPYVAPVLDALEQASEGLTSGIIGLNERLYGDDDDERTDAFLEVIRPGIETIQPI